MKKSEMITKLEMFLRDNVIGSYNKTYKQSATELLNFLEENGLKAPLTKNCPVLLRTEHVWENENDQM